MKLTNNRVQFLSICSIILASVFGTHIKSAQALNFVTYTNLGAWQAAAGGGAIFEDFDGGTLADALPASFTGFELSGSEGDTTVDVVAGTTDGNINGTNFLHWDGTGPTTPNIDFDFTNPVNAFAFNWTDIDASDAYQITIDGTNFTNPPSVIGSTGSGFFGVVATDGTFITASLSSVQSGGVIDNFGIDNVGTNATAAVPFEFSPTLGLLLVGGIAGANHLRRRASKSVALKADLS